MGTAIVAMTNTSSGPRPRKRSLANENPASVENSTTAAEMTTAMISEFVSASQNPIWPWPR